MTHTISKNGTITNQKDKTMRCPNDPGTHCKPLACGIGAEIIPAHTKKVHQINKPVIDQDVPSKIKFYCLPQPREIILSDHDAEAETEADFFSVVK